MRNGVNSCDIEEVVRPVIRCNKKQDILRKKVSLYLLCDDYVSSIADGTSVSTFLCTQKLGPEEVSVSLIAVLVHRSLMN